MTNVVQLHPEPSLLERIGPAIATAAITARDRTAEDRGEVLTALALATGRAVTIMARGDKRLASAMLPILTQAIAEAVGAMQESW